MRDMPTLKFEVNGLGEQLHSLIMLRAEEVSGALRDGVAQAYKDLDIVAIAEQAARPAIAKAVEKAVEDYFYRGEGAESLKKAVADLMREGDLAYKLSAMAIRQSLKGLDRR